jgi:hypothetical protein
MESIYHLLLRARRARSAWRESDDEERQEYYEQMRSSAEAATAELQGILELANEADLLYIGFEDPLGEDERDEDDDEYTLSERWVGAEAHFVHAVGTVVSIRAPFADGVVIGSDDPPRFLSENAAALFSERPGGHGSFTQASQLVHSLGGSNVIEALQSLRALMDDIRDKQPTIAKRLQVIADKLEMRPPR